MILIDINFTTYVPTTLLGLLGLISGYLYFYFKGKDDNRLKQIESVKSIDRVRAIEMFLNELGVTIDASNLDSQQKFLLIGKLLKAKTRKYLIASITLIILSSIIGFLLYDNNHNQSAKEKNQQTSDTTNKSVIIDSTSVNSIHDNEFNGKNTIIQGNGVEVNQK